MFRNKFYGVQQAVVVAGVLVFLFCLPATAQEAQSVEDIDTLNNKILRLKKQLEIKELQEKINTVGKDKSGNTGKKIVPGGGFYPGAAGAEVPGTSAMQPPNSGATDTQAARSRLQDLMTERKKAQEAAQSSGAAKPNQRSSQISEAQERRVLPMVVETQGFDQNLSAKLVGWPYGEFSVQKGDVFAIQGRKYKCTAIDLRKVVVARKGRRFTLTWGDAERAAKQAGGAFSSFNEQSLPSLPNFDSTSISAED